MPIKYAVGNLIALVIIELASRKLSSFLDRHSITKVS